MVDFHISMGKSSIFSLDFCSYDFPASHLCFKLLSYAILRQAVAIIRQEAAEQRALLLSEASAEVQALRGEVQTLQLGSPGIPRDQG